MLLRKRGEFYFFSLYIATGRRFQFVGIGDILLFVTVCQRVVMLLLCAYAGDRKMFVPNSLTVLNMSLFFCVLFACVVHGNRAVYVCVCGCILKL